MTIVLLKLLSSEHTSWASGLSRPDAIETKIAPLQNTVILRLKQSCCSSRFPAIASSELLSPQTLDIHTTH
jgi:hypothetical protein